MTVNPVASACRSCRYYTPEGRRGGNCEQLGVHVRSTWKACSLAIPPFAPSWEGFQEVLDWQKEMLLLQEVLPLESSELKVSQAKSASTPETELRTKIADWDSREVEEQRRRGERELAL